MTKLNKTELVIVLPREASVQEYAVCGTLEREIAVYGQLVDELHGITIVSFAGRKDLRFRDVLGKIEVMANSNFLPVPLYMRMVARKLLALPARGFIVEGLGVSSGRQAAQLAALLEGQLIARVRHREMELVRREHPEDDKKISASAALEKELFTAADRIVVPDDNVRQGIVKRYKISEGNIAIIPAFVDTEMFSPAPSLPKRKGQVLYTGSLARRKNLDMLCKAVGEVSGARLLMVGEGPMRKELEAAARKGAFRADIIGPRPHGDLPSYYNSAEVFVLVSGYETQPPSLLEAMACGACVIGADSPGIRELIDDGKNGLLVELSVPAIAAAIRKCLNEPELAGRLGRKAREKAKAFDISGAVRAEKDLYSSLNGDDEKHTGFRLTAFPKVSRSFRSNSC